MSHPLLEAFLASKPEGDVSPPQIQRFSFEGLYAPPQVRRSDRLRTYHGSSCDSDSSPDRSEDGDSELSSLGPSTPTADDYPSLKLSPRLLLTPLNKSLDDSFFKTSPTLSSRPHSFTPNNSSICHGHSSSLGLRNVISPELELGSDTIMDCPTMQVTDFSPDLAHASSSIHITTTVPQSIKEEAQQPQTTRRSRAANRSITVHQLALELPKAFSRSNSLSAFINALEDASPGWYRSLMDSALPHSGSDFLLATTQDCSTFSRIRPESDSPKSLSCTMLEEFIQELEQVADLVRQLPVPTLQTVVVDWAASPLILDSSTSSTPDRKQITSSPTALVMQSERNWAPTTPLKEVCEVMPSNHTAHVSSPNQPTLDNLVYHPKLAKTLGFRSSPSWGGAPAHVPPRSTTPPSVSNSCYLRHQNPWEAYLEQGSPEHIDRLPEQQNPFRTPKSRKITSFFRRRTPATAALAVQGWPEHQYRDPSVRANFESTSWGLWPGTGSPTNKDNSHVSSILESPTPHRHQELDSFLQM